MGQGAESQGAHGGPDTSRDRAYVHEAGHARDRQRGFRPSATRQDPPARDRTRSRRTIRQASPSEALPEPERPHHSTASQRLTPPEDHPRSRPRTRPDADAENPLPQPDSEGCCGRPRCSPAPRPGMASRQPGHARQPHRPRFTGTHSTAQQLGRAWPLRQHSTTQQPRRHRITGTHSTARHPAWYGFTLTAPPGSSAQQGLAAGPP